jgi:hypothetical protein
MSAYFEIAFAAATHRLCLFTGTGFSKAVTENKAPGWQELLEKTCDCLPNGASIKSALFPAAGNNPLSLEESAQVIAIEFAKSDKDIHVEIANQINALTLSGDNSAIGDFLQKNPIRIVTTNYDKLAEQLCDPARCQSITPGFPIPRAPADVKVYHVHGSIDSPRNMVVTSDNYFKFMNGESYFSRKLSTVLHENTVVILGYSLGDTNLKTIISDYKGFSRNHVIGGSLFLVSRNKVDQHVKDYYAHCYGIRVLDGITVHSFFQKVTESLSMVSKETDAAIGALKNVLFKGNSFKDTYLKTELSFLEITSSVAAIGRSIDDPAVVTVLDKVIQKKIEFTGIRDAWEQYAHLANWLCHLGSILELPNTSIQNTYLDAVFRSMTTMSKSRSVVGYSWYAYDSWSMTMARNSYSESKTH